MNEEGPKQAKQEAPTAKEIQPLDTAELAASVQQTRDNLHKSTDTALEAKRRVQEGKMSLLDYIREKIMFLVSTTRQSATVEVLAEPNADIRAINHKLARRGLQIKPEHGTPPGRGKPNRYFLDWTI